MVRCRAPPRSPCSPSSPGRTPIWSSSTPGRSRRCPPWSRSRPACAGGSTSSCRPACGRSAPSGRLRSPRAPRNAVRSTPPWRPCRCVEGLLARNRLAGPTTVCLVAEPRRTSVAALRSAVTTLALHGLAPAAVLARVLPVDGAGEWAARRATEQDDVLTALAEVAPVHRVHEHAVPPADVDELAGSAGRIPPRRTARRRRCPTAERHEGAWRLDRAVALRRAVGAAADPLGRRPRGQRRRRPPVDPAGRAAAPLRGDRRPAGRSRNARRAARGRVPARPAAWPADLLAAEGRTP